MRCGRREHLAGWFILLAVFAGAAWHFSQDESSACMLPEPESGSKAGFNQYSVNLVNGAPGIAWFLMDMPDSYSVYWKQALHWTMEMRIECGPEDEYIRWPHLQGEKGDTVNTRPQAGTGLAFLDAFDKTDSTIYQEYAIKAADFLMLHEGDWEVIHEDSDATFGNYAYWYRCHPPDNNNTVIYHANGGVPGIGTFFLQMYKKIDSTELDTTYYRIAREAVQYMKIVATCSLNSGDKEDPVWARWLEKNNSPSDKYATYLCWGTPGIVCFLDSMYRVAADLDLEDSLTDFRYARAGLQWLMDSVQVDTTDSGDTLYWWHRYPYDTKDTTYSPTWGQGAAGIGETFLLVGLKDLARDDTDSAMYYRFAKRAAKWVHSMAEPHSGGWRWVYRLGHTTGDTVYYTYRCRGQGPILRFFARMYDQARDSVIADSDSALYRACADTGRMYLDSTKVRAYEGSDVWIWDGCDDDQPDSPYKAISVSFENGPPGLGRVMLNTAQAIGAATSADSADSVKFMELAYHCANWLKAEYHADSVFGGYKWPWRAAEDSITVELVNKSCATSPTTPCTLRFGDTFKCSLYIYNWSNVDKDNVFWWVDFLRWDNKFHFFADSSGPDSGTISVPADSFIAVYVEHDMSQFNNLPANAKLVSANGSAAYRLLYEYEADDTTKTFSLDQDCFRVWVWWGD
jgi:hypothetical protein